MGSIRIAFDGQRLLVREGNGKVNRSHPPKDSIHSLKLCLFSDLILWLNPQTRAYRGQFELAGACLTVLQNQDLQIVTEKEILYLRIQKEERANWIADINKTIRNLRRNRRRFENHSRRVHQKNHLDLSPPSVSKPRIRSASVILVKARRPSLNPNFSKSQFSPRAIKKPPPEIPRVRPSLIFSEPSFIDNGDKSLSDTMKNC